LGGDDFDELLLDHVCDRFRDEYDFDLRESLTTKSRVLRAVEEAKRRLSFDAFANLREEFIAEKTGTPLHLNMELSRLDYELLIEPLVTKTLVCVDEALSDARLTAGQIDRVVLVGGASRTPLVQRLVSEQLGKPIHAEVDPDLCVSMGAAMQGGLIAGMDLGPVLVDITSHTLGIQCHGALLGFESDYRFAPLIRRNTPLPASRSEVFTTMCDGQKVVLIHAYQGENDDVRHNEPIGQFTLDGLADVQAGNEILVRFNLDLDGILTVTATERSTGLEKAVMIENALSRFRQQDRQNAHARIDAAFGTGPPARAKTSVVEEPADAARLAEHLRPELSEAIAQADQVLAKSERLVGDIQGPDAEEMQQLASQLRKAVNAMSLPEIKKIVAQLDDLVFYLQDA
jgi:molecular chaperone DnaK